MLSNSNKSELPSSSTIITINIIRRKSQSQTEKEIYEKEESTYPSKDKEKSSKNKSMKEYIYSWKHRDRKETNDFCQKLLYPVRGECQLPIELSELLFSETSKYASQKENHTLDLKKQKLRSFIAVVILRGYIDLPRLSMYWEMTEDIHNSIVTSLFTRSRFSEVVKNLHLADNDNFHNSERFAKVHP